MSNYVIVSPVKNEERYLSLTIESVLNQTMRPSLWIIVNDGSTDRTEDIIRNYTEQHDWIRLINNYEKENIRERGSKIVRAFYKGYDSINNMDYDFIVKLDGDVSFQKDFIERINKEFIKRPKLGITSGISHIQNNNTWSEEKSAKGHTLGATKFYRKECFHEIGGLVPFIGWDGIDEIKARLIGWEAESIPDLKVYHHRPEGIETGLMKAFFEDGTGAYFMGYHPLFVVIRGLWNMKSRPFILGGLNIIYAYFKCYWQKKERIVDEEFIRFIRKEQIKKLTLRKSLV